MSDHLNNLILCGFRGCGKTTIGRMLAQKLNWDFIDTDALLEQTFERQYRLQLLTPDIYHYLGDEEFRAFESSTIQELDNTEQTVISLGGGAIINQASLSHLHALGKLIYLQLSKVVIRSRMQADPAVFLASERSFDKEFEAYYSSREHLYPLAADIIVDINQLHPREIVSKLTCYAEPIDA